MTEKQITIREAECRDLRAVLGLYADLGMDDGQVLPLEQAEALFRKMQNYPDYRLYLAMIDEVPVGTFALLVMDNLGHCGAPSAIVEDVVVAPGQRGNGIGQGMMHFAYRQAQLKGCYKIALSTNINRTGAHRFYESLGFRKHGYSYFVDVHPLPENETYGGDN